MNVVECFAADRSRSFSREVRRDAVGRRTRVGLPDAKAAGVGLRRRARPRLRVGAKLLQRAVRVRPRPQQETAPVDTYALAEFVLDPTQPDRCVVAPRSEIVGVDDQPEQLHARRLAQAIGATKAQGSRCKTTHTMDEVFALHPRRVVVGAGTGSRRRSCRTWPGRLGAIVSS